MAPKVRKTILSLSNLQTHMSWREAGPVPQENCGESPRSPRCVRPASRNAGFTLIEIMLVLGIVSMIMAVGLPAISRITYQRINSTTRKFVGLIRTVRTDAILLNSIYRLVIDLEHNAYWVETQKEFKLLVPDDEFAKSTKDKKKEKEPPPSNFSMAEKYSSKPIPLPVGVAFDGVLKERDGLIKEGIAYIYFFPNGFNDHAILYLGKEGEAGRGYSLLIRSTSGRVDISPGVLKTFDQAIQ